MRCGCLLRKDACWRVVSDRAAFIREWCDAEMLRLIRRKSLAKLRREVEPVEQHTLAAVPHALARAAESEAERKISIRCWMQREFAGAPLPASLVESAIFAGADCGV